MRKSKDFIVAIVKLMKDTCNLFFEFIIDIINAIANLAK